MTRSKAKESIHWASQVVNIIEPHLQSAAALVLLAKQYFLMDKSIFTNKRMHKLRNKWIRKQMRTPDSAGGLTCQICKRQGLIPFNGNLKNRATLDHIIEISNGGLWNDESNFQVACDMCNRTKSETK